MSINKNNYEEWIVAFLDNELSADQVLAFEKFMDENPALKSELAAYQNVKFAPTDHIVFENREALYQKNEALVLLKKIWPLAAALVLFLGLLPFLKNDKGSAPSSSKVVRKDTQISSVPKVAEVIKNTENVDEETTEAVVNKSEKNDETRPKSNSLPQPNTKKQIVQKALATIPNADIIKEPSPALNKVEKSEIRKMVGKTEMNIVPKPDSINLTKTAVVENIFTEKKPTVISTKMASVENENTANRAGTLLVISKESTPVLHEKIDGLVSKIEDNIETIKELKKTPITVCIGKRKLFTINN